MKIAIPFDDGKIISSHFGRTKGFVIFEVEDKEKKKEEFIPNTFTGHARGLEGKHDTPHHNHILSALNSFKVVISHGMGKRIYDNLRNAGIEV